MHIVECIYIGMANCAIITIVFLSYVLKLCCYRKETVELLSLQVVTWPVEESMEIRVCIDDCTQLVVPIIAMARDSI